MGVSNVDVCGSVVGTDMGEGGMDKVSLRAMCVGDVCSISKRVNYFA